MKFSSALISVCIPVFETEMYLAQCLRSVLMQDFNDFEVIIVSDASRGKDTEGRSAKKIVKHVQKECIKFRKENSFMPVKVMFDENSKNRGIIEVRRTLVSKASGSYIAMIDSDDVLAQGALKAFYSVLIQKEDVDIVQGGSVSGVFDREGNFLPEEKNRYGIMIPGKVRDHEIFNSWCVKKTIPGVLWAKLIKRSLFQKAFEYIPYTECNMSEDFLLSFFITLNAKKYTGIKNKVYFYRIMVGVSSGRKITTLEKWKKICSSAGVFSIIADWIENHKNDSESSGVYITAEEISSIKKLTCYYLFSNLKQMRETVIPELQEEAYKILCEFWGESFVKRIEKALEYTDTAEGNLAQKAFKL